MLRWAATKLSGVEKEEEKEGGKKKADQGHQDLDQGQEEYNSCGSQVAVETAVDVGRSECKLP